MDPSSFRILLVAHDECVGETVARYLLHRGFDLTQVSTFADARRALTNAAAAFDVVLSELDLPDGNGMDIAQQLIDRPATRVIVMTGELGGAEMAALLFDGRAEILPRPFSPRTLMLHIEGPEMAQAA